MIYITGDTHADFKRFNTKAFPEQKEMTRDDRVIICGDFGGIWSDTPEERYWLKWLNDKPFTTVYVDGNHENYDRYYGDEFPVVDYCGGKAHQIRPNIYHLMRGYVFEFEGKKFFTFGGASSHDISDGILDAADYEDPKEFGRVFAEKWLCGELFRVNHISWWKEEIPSKDEMQRGIQSLAEHGNKVDYVITHCLPTSIAAAVSDGFYKPDALTDYFDKLLKDGLQFKEWHCGHYHRIEQFMGAYNIHYEDIYRLM